MLLRFLGSGSAFSPGRMFSSILLEDRILLDPSPTSPVGMKYFGVPPGEIEAVLITHMHGDHFLGLPFLFLHWYYRDPPTSPVNVFLPEGGGRIVEEVLSLSYPNLSRKIDLKRIWRVVEVSPGESFNLPGGGVVEVFEMEHAGLPAQGYLVVIDGSRVGYTGDTDLCRGLKMLAERSDVFITELSSWEKEIPSHLSRSKLEVLSPHLKGVKHLFLTHTEGIPKNAAIEHLRAFISGEIHLPGDLTTYVVC